MSLTSVGLGVHTKVPGWSFLCWCGWDCLASLWCLCIVLGPVLPRCITSSLSSGAKPRIQLLFFCLRWCSVYVLAWPKWKCAPLDPRTHWAKEILHWQISIHWKGPEPGREYITKGMYTYGSGWLRCAEQIGVLVVEGILGSLARAKALEMWIYEKQARRTFVRLLCHKIEHMLRRPSHTYHVLDSSLL